MVIISTGGLTTKLSSIEAIVTESRPHSSQPLSGYYQVHGKLKFLEINSPYHHENEDKEKFPSYGENIGGFTLSGVVEQEGYVLAFRYDAKETFQPKNYPSSRQLMSSPEGVKEESPEFIHEWLQCSRRAGFSKYLHLRAALAQPNVNVHLRGGIEYAPPRLLHVERMYVDGELLKYAHGDISGDFQDKPLLR